jgi:CRISPR system Cascade subunit CasD
VQSYLILKLHGPLQGWGTHTYEDYRPSSLFPTHSGILGLLAACLGIARRDQERLQTLDQSIEFAVRADHVMLDDDYPLSLTKITDFHTVMGARRVDGRASRYPVVSRREYLCDAVFTVAIRESPQPGIRLGELEAAVQKPYYTPFLGRRSCPLSRPLWEQRLDAESFEQVLEQVEPRRGIIYSEWIDREHSRLQLRDIPLRVAKRQFATRYVNIKRMRERKADVP